MSDKLLIRRIKKKSRFAMDEVVKIYGGYVYTVTRSILCGMQQEDIEDTVQDVFLKIWLRAELIDEERPLKPYITAMARNTAKNRLRSEYASQPLDEDIPVELDIDGRLDTASKLKIVDEVLKSLKSEDREVFLRHYYYFQHVSEIADTMGLGKSAVKMKLLRTRKKLAAELSERGYEYESEHTGLA